jgi:hypothetical protein
VAIAVVGGVVALALALFVVWKLKRKRFGGYDDDDGEFGACGDGVLG